MGGGAWPFLVGGAICLVNSVNERDLNLLNSRAYLLLVSFTAGGGQAINPCHSKARHRWPRSAAAHATPHKGASVSRRLGPRLSWVAQGWAFLRFLEGLLCA